MKYEKKLVGVRMDDELLAYIDKKAAQDRLSRTAYIRMVFIKMQREEEQANEAND